MYQMKTQESIEEQTALLEKQLILFLRPSFLHITEPDFDDDIQVLISTRQFNNKTVQERISTVFKIIKTHCPKILKDRLLVIQAYTPNEMDDILDYVFNDEQHEGE